MRKLLVVGALLFTLFGVACDQDTTTYEVTADDVVDVMSPSVVQQFCTAYDTLGSYDLALQYFTEGYGTSQDPSAQEVFDELLTRC